jgi:triphosphatase
VLAQPNGAYENTAMTYEIELKLRFDPAQADILAAAIGARAQPASQSRLNNTYYDTPDGRLSAAGCALRIRQKGPNIWEQTLKTRGQSLGGLHKRLEWNWPLASNSLDFGLLFAPEVQENWPRDVEPAALIPLFSTGFQRQAWIWQLGNSKAEVVMDRGVVRAGDKSTPLCEVELELLEGDTEVLWWMASSLCSSVPLWISDITKAERGFRLVGLGRRWQPAKGGLLSAKAEQEMQKLGFASPLALAESFQFMKRALEEALWDQQFDQARLALEYILAFFTLATADSANTVSLPRVALMQPLLSLACSCAAAHGLPRDSALQGAAIQQLQQLRSQAALSQQLLSLAEWMWRKATTDKTDIAMISVEQMLERMRPEILRAGEAAWLDAPQNLVFVALLAPWLDDGQNGPATDARQQFASQLLKTGMRQAALPSGDEHWRILQDGMAERHQRLAAIVGTLVATGSDSFSES